MRNVLHLIDTFETGGAETVFAQLVAGLDRSRFRSIPAVLGRGWLHGRLTELGHTPLVIETSGSFDAAFVRRLRSVVMEHRIDLIQTHLLTSAVYGGVVGRMAGVPVVSTFHGVVDVQKSWIRMKIALVNHGASRIAFVSETLRREVLASTSLAPELATVIRNGVDLARFRTPDERSWRRSIGVSDDEFLIGGVGRATAVKNFPSLLRAVAQLREDDPRIALVVVGAEAPDGDSREHEELMRLRSALGLEQAVRFVGFQSDMPAVMQSLDVLAVTSLSEGFSLTTIEAMACGVPVIATRCGGPEEILSDGRDGILIPVNETPALVEALRRVRVDQALRTRISASGRSTVERRFSLTRTLDRYENLYDSLIDTRPSPRAPTRGPRARGPIGKIKRSALTLLTSSMAAPLLRPFTRDAATILMLHRFADPELGIEGHDPVLLAGNLAHLRRNRFVISSLGDLVKRLAAGEPPLPRTVVFTVDDGYADFGRIGAPIFARYDCPVTTFLVTGFVDGECWLWYDVVEHLFGAESRGALDLTVGDVTTRVTWASTAERIERVSQVVAHLKTCPTDQVERAVRELARGLGVDISSPPARYSPMTWSEVRRCEELGANFGPHTHRHPILARACDDRARTEIEHAWQRLQAETDAPVPVFCYPNGMPTDYSARERSLVRSAGLTAAVAARGGHCALRHFATDPFALPRLAYQEDPIDFQKTIGGLERLNLALRRR